MGVGRVRLQTRGRSVVEPCFISTSETLEQISVAEMKFAVIWLQSQCCLHLRCCRIKFRLVRQHKSKVHMRFRICAVESECELILFFCLLPLAFSSQGMSIIRMLNGAKLDVAYGQRVPSSLRDC